MTLSAAGILARLEDGRLTRRQVIQSLLALSTAGVATGATTGLARATQFSRRELEARFARAEPVNTLYGSDYGSRNFSISTVAAGQSPGSTEIHATVTRIFYVVRGSVTMRTGGKLINAQALNQETIRARGMEGGESRTLSRGDLLIVPDGLSHSMSQVEERSWLLMVSFRTASENADAKAAIKPSPVFFSKTEIDAGFESHVPGAALYTSNYGLRNFIIKTNSRSTPSITPEIHPIDSEIIYVAKGSATMMTGGKLVDVLTEATWNVHQKDMGLPGDRPVPEGVIDRTIIAGRSMTGGEPHHLNEGDVIIVPHGMSFWIKEVRESFWFLNVKCR